MITHIKELEEGNGRVKRELQEYKAKLDASERTEAERKILDEQRRAEEVSSLKQQVAEIKANLDKILSV